MSNFSKMTHLEMEFVGTVLAGNIGADKFELLAQEQQKFIFESVFAICSELSMDYVLDECEQCPLHVIYLNCL